MKKNSIQFLMLRIIIWYTLWPRKYGKLHPSLNPRVANLYLAGID